MPERRVVITGIGLISALGSGKDEHSQALFDGAVGIDRIKAFDPSGFASHVGGEAPVVKMNKLVPKAQRKSVKLMSRDIELAVIAADHAMRDAGLNTRANNPDGPIDIDPTRSGINIGAGAICCDIAELAAAAENAKDKGVFSLKKWGNEGMECLTPLWLLKYLPNMLSCHISIIYDLQGPSNSITCAEASGLLAINEARNHIAHGKADIMIAGGSEDKVNAMALLRQCKQGRASTNYNDNPGEASRPFDKNADGNVVGQGAGILILEELERAQKRGAKIYAEISGAGASNTLCDNYLTPDSEAVGMTVAMAKALEQANVKPEDIDLLIPHGLGIVDYDKAESNAIANAFGEHSKDLPIMLTKSRVGNCGAGSSAIDLAIAALIIKGGKVPGNVNCPDPISDGKLNILGPDGVDKKLKNIMTSCYSYGGQTAAMILRQEA